MDHLELMLSTNESEKMEFIQHFLDIVKTTFTKASHTGQKLIDLMFDRRLMLEYSWSGRGNTIAKVKPKKPFMQYTYIVKCVHAILYALDDYYSMHDNKYFFMRILSKTRANKKLVDRLPPVQ